MSVWVQILIIFSIFFFTLITNWFFNYRIHLIAKNKFLSAAWTGSIATTFSAFFFGIIALSSISGQPIWFIVAELIALALSSYLGTYFVPMIEKRLQKNKQNKINKKAQ